MFGPVIFLAALAITILAVAAGTRRYWRQKIGLGLFRSLRTTTATLQRPPVTVQYPLEKIPVHQRFRGIPALLWDEEVGEEKCVACDICARECPVDVIYTSGKPNPKAKTGQSTRKRIVDRFDLNYALCIYCGICVEVCPFDALAMSRTYEIAAESPGQFVLDKDQLLELTLGHKPRRDPPGDGQSEVEARSQVRSPKSKVAVLDRDSKPGARDSEPGSDE